jgi:hypothetical protein
MVGYKRNVSKDDPSYLPAQYQANPLKDASCIQDRVIF